MQVSAAQLHGYRGSDNSNSTLIYWPRRQLVATFGRWSVLLLMESAEQMCASRRHSMERHMASNNVGKRWTPWVSWAAVAAVAISLGGCAPRRVVVIRPAPPPPQYEVVPAPPYAGAVWIGGHWAWRAGAYVWIGGYYVHPTPGVIWVPGYWQRTWRGPRWIPGHYRPV